MIGWLFNLFRCRRVDSQCGDLPQSLSGLNSYPTTDTVQDWDKASLFAAVGSVSALRFHEHGFEELNDTERTMCCLYLLEADVNNGGFGQWIWNSCPASAAATPYVLQAIGSTEMAAFVTRALLPFGDLTRFKSQEAWCDYYLAIADDLPISLESLTKPFLKLEDRFLDRAYAYTRAHWMNVRTA